MSNRKGEKDTINLKAHHCGISVPDIDASIAWYCDNLGFSLEQRMNLDAVGAGIAFLKHGDFHLELFEVKDAKPLPEERRNPNTDLLTHGTKHVAFIVEDLEKVARILKERGVDFAMEISNMPDGRVMFIRDNSGVLLEIIEQ